MVIHIDQATFMSEKKKGKPAHNKGKSGPDGENVGNAAFTQSQADQIREEYKIVKSLRKLAAKYNVSKRTILAIINNETYKIIAEGKLHVQQKLWFVYIIRSLKDNTLYTGITLDVEARLKTHNEGRGARYTRGRTPFVIIKIFTCDSKSEALKLEHRIKQMSRAEKLKL